MPGTPHYVNPALDALALASARMRTLCFPVVGVFVGDDDACSALLLEAIQRRLRPLEYVASLTDTDKVHHAKQLAAHMLRLVAESIPDYWMATMLPHQTADAARWADGAIHGALASILGFSDSPTARQAIADLAASLPVAIGGLALCPHTEQREPKFAGTFVAVWPTCCAICPDLRDLVIADPDPTSPPPATAAAFHRAYSNVRTLLGTVRSRFTAYDANVRTWVDGSKHSGFRPRLSSSLVLGDPALVFDDAVNKSSHRSPERSFTAVANADRWLRAHSVHYSFDLHNAGLASVREREATRLVSCSQPGAGDFLKCLPDQALRGSIVHSDAFVAACQRRLGLYLSALASILDACAAFGKAVTQHDRLGDSFINTANHSHRHAAGLRATYDAFAALSVANQPAGHLKLGDRGDGTPAGKETARQRYAHVNSGHVPDFIRFGIHSHCYEFKCYTPFITSPALGLGSKRCGGAASTADGAFFALGNTEEALIVVVVGVEARGDPTTDRALNRETGEGWVAATTDHDYADAQRRGNPVTLLVMETTGALSPTFHGALRALDKQSRAPTTHDSTLYGVSRASPRGFAAHHLARISTAVAVADATTLLLAAAAMSFKLSVGVVP